MRAILVPDAGRRVGLGHVGRCVALAQALETQGWDARLILSDSDAVRFARSLGVRTAREPTGTWSVAVIDSYQRPHRQIAALRQPGSQIVVVDDLHLLKADAADLVLRPSIGERPGPGILAGAEYVLLRKEYWNRRSRGVTSKVRRVLITLGGFPDGRLVGEAVDTLLQVLPAVEVEIAGIVPPGRWRRSGVQLTGRVPSLLPALRTADLVLSAGGQTMNEALASGTPTLVLGTAPNQRRNLKAVGEANAAEVLGWATSGRWRARLKSTTRTLASSAYLRTRLARRAGSLVDGKGALRTAAAIAEL